MSLTNRFPRASAAAAPLRPPPPGPPVPDPVRAPARAPAVAITALAATRARAPVPGPARAPAPAATRAPAAADGGTQTAVPATDTATHARPPGAAGTRPAEGAGLCWRMFALGQERVLGRRAGDRSGQHLFSWEAPVEAGRGRYPKYGAGHGGVSLAFTWTSQSAGPGNLVGGASAFEEEGGFPGDRGAGAVAVCRFGWGNHRWRVWIGPGLVIELEFLRL